LRSSSKDLTLVKLPYGQSLCQLQWENIGLVFGAEMMGKLEAWQSSLPAPRVPRTPAE
jgi:hypothetical protein